MNYTRTENKIIKTKKNKWNELVDKQGKYIAELEIIAQADTIEELCDEFVLVDKMTGKHCLNDVNDYYYLKEEVDEYKVFGAIWTPKGLIYVAKMNSDGILELI